MNFVPLFLLCPFAHFGTHNEEEKNIEEEFVRRIGCCCFIIVAFIFEWMLFLALHRTCECLLNSLSPHFSGDVFLLFAVVLKPAHLLLSFHRYAHTRPHSADDATGLFLPDDWSATLLSILAAESGENKPPLHVDVLFVRWTVEFCHIFFILETAMTTMTTATTAT